MVIKLLKLAQVEIEEAVTHSYQQFSPGTRRCLIAKFPYGIIYDFSPEHDEIVIVAIAHLHRRPDYWVSRDS